MFLVKNRLFSWYQSKKGESCVNESKQLPEKRVDNYFKIHPCFYITNEINDKTHNRSCTNQGKKDIAAAMEQHFMSNSFFCSTGSTKIHREVDDLFMDISMLANTTKKITKFELHVDSFRNFDQS